MKADVVIIGGGLASLVSGIKFLKAGKSVIIVSSGQSALHFSSGSMGLLSHVDGRDVEHPLEELEHLPKNHPYHKVGGKKALEGYLKEAHEILSEAGIEMKGSTEKNHFKLTPFGIFSPAWLSLSDHLTVDSLDEIPWKKIALVGIKGFLDFFPAYLEEGLGKYGIECSSTEVTGKVFDTLRLNPTEMRAPNIARALDDEGIVHFAEMINSASGDADAVIIPAVVGLNDTKPWEHLKSLVDKELYSVATTPNSVPGIRMQIQLQRLFKKLGGWYLLGDMVTDGLIEDNKVKSVNTFNLGSSALTSENFILATGSFFSRGLRATQNRIVEPIFGLDVAAPENRDEWFDHNLFKSQPFMKFGVKTDAALHCQLKGQTIDNLYAIGAIIEETTDPLHEGAGAGVALGTSLFVTDRILNG